MVESSTFLLRFSCFCCFCCFGFGMARKLRCPGTRRRRGVCRKGGGDADGVSPPVREAIGSRHYDNWMLRDALCEQDVGWFEGRAAGVGLQVGLMLVSGGVQVGFR